MTGGVNRVTGVIPSTQLRSFCIDQYSHNLLLLCARPKQTSSIMNNSSEVYTGVPATEMMAHTPTEPATDKNDVEDTTFASSSATVKIVVLASVLGFLMSCFLTAGAGLLGHYILLHDEPPRQTIIFYLGAVVLWYTTVSIVLCAVVVGLCNLLQEESWAMEAVEKHSWLWTILEIIMLTYVCMEHAWFLPMWAIMNLAIYACWRMTCPQDDAPELSDEELDDKQQPLLLVV